MAELAKGQMLKTGDGPDYEDPRPVIEAISQAVINIGRTAAAHEKKINDIEIQVAQTLKLMSKILKALEAEAE